MSGATRNTKELENEQMAGKFESFVEDLQNQIYEEMREAYGDVAFERWLHPRYMGAIENADGYAGLQGTCGDSMEIFLKFENDRVREASFRTDGCAYNSVCGSFAAEMALGKTPEEILDISGEAILKRLGRLPDEERHCVYLAAETLQEAVKDYMLRQTKR